MLLTIISCSSDKQAKLTELKKKRDAISEQIKKLEDSIPAGDSLSENFQTHPS